MIIIPFYLTDLLNLLCHNKLAQKLNLTNKAISKWERGLSFPDISMLELLAETLDVSV